MIVTESQHSFHQKLLISLRGCIPAWNSTNLFSPIRHSSTLEILFPGNDNHLLNMRYVICTQHVKQFCTWFLRGRWYHHPYLQMRGQLMKCLAQGHRASDDIHFTSKFIKTLLLNSISPTYSRGPVSKKHSGICSTDKGCHCIGCCTIKW